MIMSSILNPLVTTSKFFRRCLIWPLTALLLLVAGTMHAAAQQQEKSLAPDDSKKTNPATDDTDRIETGKSVTREYDFTAAGKKMEYQVYLPKNYYDEIDADKKKTFPLIVALHGYGSNPKQLMGYPGFTRYAEKSGFLIVAPMGYNSRGWYGSRGLRGGRGKDPDNLGELSEKDVMNVLQIARDDFQIDEKRIYLYGHSMGGGGALHLAMKYPKIWAAIAPMAPAIPAGLKNLPKAKEIPVFVVHGDNDRVLSVKGTRRLVEKMKELKIVHQYVEVKNGGHVLVAFQYWKEIFTFFEKHRRKNQSESSLEK
jgi:predicted peptidase